MLKPKRALFSLTVLLGLGVAAPDSRAAVVECLSEAWPNTTDCTWVRSSGSLVQGEGIGTSSSSTAHVISAQLVTGTRAIAIALDNSGTEVGSTQDLVANGVPATFSFTTTVAKRPRQIMVLAFGSGTALPGSDAVVLSNAWPNFASVSLANTSSPLVFADSLASSQSSTSHFIDCTISGSGANNSAECVALMSNGQPCLGGIVEAPASHSFTTTAAGRPRRIRVTGFMD